jgi:mono/diheme cytochrome c family protein
MLRPLLAAALLTLAACDTRVAGGSADGAAVYAAACATCHGPGGKPPESMASALKVRDLTSSEFRGRATLELVTSQIRHGSANKIMPAFAGALSDAQIAAVAAYVMALPASK